MSLKDTNDTFSFFLPVEALEKSETDPKDDTRYVQGIASTDHTDLQNEKVVQNGIDFSYFTKHGFINDDHKPGVENKVGEPVEVRLTKAGLWIKALLYKGKERSDYWWEHLTSLEQSKSTRKVGFSIQGKVQRRNGNSITKCWIQDVAITASPVNTHTWAEIVKSLCAEKYCIHPWKSLEKACKGCPGKSACETPLVKNIETASPSDEDEEKALTVGGMGRILSPQSLEGSVKSELHKSEDLITAEQAIDYLQKERNYSKNIAKAIVDSIFFKGQ
jgi:hypothetical protein